MHQVQISDQLYQEAARRASKAGFKSVDDFVADVLHQGLVEDELDPAELEARFTPDVLAALDESAAQIEAGQFFTIEEVKASLAGEREAWLESQES